MSLFDKSKTCEFIGKMQYGFRPSQNPILDRDRTIYKIYNGWWYVGRPTVEEIRMDLRALLSRRNDWVYPGTGKPPG